MGMMSAAEARLDADIRPEITVLRSRSPYPARRRPAASARRETGSVAGVATGRPLAACGDGTSALSALGDPSAAPGQARSASGQARSAADPAVAEVSGAGQPTSAPSGEREMSTRRARAARPTPIRLTRRGRIVVAALAIIASVAVASVVWLAVVGQAQASGRVTPTENGSQSMRRIVVKSGQTLWSLAVWAEPTADPRGVIQQIIDANSLAGPAIQPGEVLWVPRG